MTFPKRPHHSIEDFHAEHLECLRIMWHRELAIGAALHYCAANKLVPPTWLVEEAASTYCGLLKNQKATKQRGRASGIAARYRQDQIDYERWCAITEVRDKQTEIKEEVEELRSRKRRGVPVLELQDREKMLNWVGRRWVRALECASMLLRGTDAQGSPEAMKASYLRVKKHNKDGRLRYHLLDQGFLALVGIDIQFEPKGRKFVPFYDLTI
jgi:hypothetical protein